MNSFIDTIATVRVQPLAGATCLVVAFRWWLRHRDKTDPATAGPVDGGECDAGCNDPKCLRCHSSSRLHAAKFRANATMLRRLARLEPFLFEGMREEIWFAVNDMERKFERSNDVQRGLFVVVGKLLEGCLRRWQKMNPGASAAAGGKLTAEKRVSCSPATPLSPQSGQDPTVFFLPGLEAVPLHDADGCRGGCPCARLWRTLPVRPRDPPIKVTGDVEALMSNHGAIRQELLDFVSGDRSSPELFRPFDPKVYTHAGTAALQDSGNARRHSHRPEWSSVYLYHQGLRQSETCNEYFPRTAHVLETKCPHLMAGKCGLGSVYFSKLGGNTRVREHCGPTNVRWRCHLPLVVPERCDGLAGGMASHLCVGLRGVNETRIGWREGVPLLFDDSFVHSAVHHHAGDSSGDGDNGNNMYGARIVLIVDFWHPSLSEPDRVALGVLYPPGS